MNNVAELHNRLVERLSVLADAVDDVFEIADAAAAIAEADPRLSGYLEALAPLMSLSVPNAPTPPTL